MTQKGGMNIFAAAKELGIKYSTACDITKYWHESGLLYRSAMDQTRAETIYRTNLPDKTPKKRQLIVKIEAPDGFQKLDQPGEGALGYDHGRESTCIKSAAGRKLAPFMLNPLCKPTPEILQTLAAMNQKHH